MFSYPASSFIGNSLPRFFPMKKRVVKISGEVRAAAAVTTSPVEETNEYEFLSFFISVLNFCHESRWCRTSAALHASQGGQTTLACKKNVYIH